MSYLNKLYRLSSRAKRLVQQFSVSVSRKVVSTPPPQDKLVDFTCNVCGNQNRAILLERVQNRECQSCVHCGSSLRMRSVIYALSMELFGKALVLPDFPIDKSISGLGMSDWEGYASGLAKKLAYTNTFYHTEPHLDIANVSATEIGKHRFLLSSDVFEHIPVLALPLHFETAH